MLIHNDIDLDIGSVFTFTKIETSLFVTSQLKVKTLESSHWLLIFYLVIGPIFVQKKIKNLKASLRGMFSDSLNWFELAWQYLAMIRNNLCIISISSRSWKVTVVLRTLHTWINFMNFPRIDLELWPVSSEKHLYKCQLIECLVFDIV